MHCRDSGEGSETNRLKRDTAGGYLDEIAERTGVSPRGARLLEVGPGLGNLLIEAVARGYDVTGVEYSASSVRTANERIGRPAVVQGSLSSVQLPEASFDIAVLCVTPAAADDTAGPGHAAGLDAVAHAAPAATLRTT